MNKWKIDKNFTSTVFKVDKLKQNKECRTDLRIYLVHLLFDTLLLYKHLEIN